MYTRWQLLSLVLLNYLLSSFYPQSFPLFCSSFSYALFINLSLSLFQVSLLLFCVSLPLLSLYLSFSISSSFSLISSLLLILSLSKYIFRSQSVFVALTPFISSPSPPPFPPYLSLSLTLPIALSGLFFLIILIFLSIPSHQHIFPVTRSMK